MFDWVTKHITGLNELFEQAARWKHHPRYQARYIYDDTDAYILQICLRRDEPSHE